MTGTYIFADRRVRIHSLHGDVHALCQAYRSCGTPDLEVRTDQADIAFEREKSAREDAVEGIPARSFPDGYLETLAVCRRIAERLPDCDTFLFHGSAIAVDGQAYIFTAKSGTGKSTHARLWRELLGDRAVMVNDDKPLIRITDKGAVVYGTPWDGKHHLSSNIAVPLRAVCPLERAAENHIRAITPSEALPMLLRQVYRPMDAAAMEKTMKLIDRLMKAVRFYRLGCNMSIEAARLSYDAMRR